MVDRRLGGIVHLLPTIYHLPIKKNPANPVSLMTNVIAGTTDHDDQAAVPPAFSPKNLSEKLFLLNCHYPVGSRGEREVR